MQRDGVALVKFLRWLESGVTSRKKKKKIQKKTTALFDDIPVNLIHFLSIIMLVDS